MLHYNHTPLANKRLLLQVHVFQTTDTMETFYSQEQKDLALKSELQTHIIKALKTINRLLFYQNMGSKTNQGFYPLSDTYLEMY